MHTTWSRRTRLAPLVGLAGLVPIAAATGCLDTHTGLKPRGSKPETAMLHSANDDETRYGWSRISIGVLPRPTPYGFMRTQKLGRDDPGGALGETREVHWLYDRDWNLVGCMSPRGATTRFNPHGDPEFLGNMQLDDAIRAVFDVRTRDEVLYIKMPTPKG
jgi:hypothetical protein